MEVEVIGGGIGEAGHDGKGIGGGGGDGEDATVEVKENNRG